MGAWDATSFGNDTAKDWAYGLDECNDLSLIDSALQNIIDTGEGYIDASDAEEAIAAVEVLAWLLNRPSETNAYTEKISEWVKAHPLTPPAELVQKALRVLNRIQAEPSELLELWEDNSEWKDALQGLIERLSK